MYNDKYKLFSIEKGEKSMEVFVTILVIGLICIVLFKLINDRNHRGDGPGDASKDEKMPIFKGIENVDQQIDSGTMVIPEIYIEEFAIDKNGIPKVVNKIPIRRIFDTDNPNDPDNRIIVICSPEENGGKDYTDDYYRYVHLKKSKTTDGISKQHLHLAKDSKGYFAKDNDSTNGTYLYSNNSATKVKQFDINKNADGTIVRLGQYWIRFRIPVEKLPNFDFDNTDIGHKTGTKIHKKPSISRD